MAGPMGAYLNIPPHHKAVLQMAQVLAKTINKEYALWRIGAKEIDLERLVADKIKGMAFFSELVSQVPYNHWKAFGHMRKVAQMSDR
jgi:hypothetical protein